MSFPSQEFEEDNRKKELPELYSKRLILLFAILFSTIFAAVLLVINLRSLGKRSVAGWVLLFAVGYLLATAILMQSLNLAPSYSIIANVIGAAILNEFFWNKYIGSETEFRKKGWAKPTAISVLIALAVFSLMMLAA